MKHYVRHEAWLPVCRRRLERLRISAGAKQPRRLRYFTFCAVGAIDVLMLDVAKIVRQSEGGEFDTVHFFDRSTERVFATRQRIPGAIGYSGEFTEIVLMNDPEEDLLDGAQEVLEAPPDQRNVEATRRSQQKLSVRRHFVRNFPFDVINLDLEEFMFKPTDPMPGRVINAFRKLFHWQTRQIVDGKRTEHLDGFSLMFTTQLGPPNLSEEYLAMLRTYLETNLQADPGLSTILKTRTGTDDVAALQATNFEAFFKLAMPKALAALLREADWAVDPDSGIRILEFERPSLNGPYKMVHLVLDVKRQTPPKNRRAPGLSNPVAEEEYRSVARRIFQNSPEVVTEPQGELKGKLEGNLEKVLARRKKYFPTDS